MEKYISILIRVADREAFVHAVEMVANSAYVAATEGYFTDEEFGEGATAHITDHAEMVLDFIRAVDGASAGETLLASTNDGGLRAPTGSLLN